MRMVTNLALLVLKALLMGAFHQAYPQSREWDCHQTFDGIV